MAIYHHQKQMDFNSQPHKEADYVHTRNSTVRKHFNSQPHKEADARCLFSMEYPRDFNSQPHKEADRARDRTCRRERISTHSLTRRLTQAYAPYWVSKCISTHSLTRRLTAAASLCLSAYLAFQLTASQGG